MGCWMLFFCGWMLFFRGWVVRCFFSWVSGWLCGFYFLVGRWVVERMLFFGGLVDVLFCGWMFYLVGGRMFFLWVGICDLFNQLVTDVIIQQQKRKTKILSNQQPIG